MKIFPAAVGGMTGILCAGFLQSCGGGGYIAATGTPFGNGGTAGVYGRIYGRIALATP